MNPIRLRSRTDVLELIREKAPRRAVRRAIDERPELVIFWGGFDPVRPFKWAGWVADVTSRHGKTWTVAVLAVDLPTPHYQVELIDEIPWGSWAPVGGMDHWSQGDEPDVCFRNRERAGSPVP